MESGNAEVAPALQWKRYIGHTSNPQCTSAELHNAHQRRCMRQCIHRTVLRGDNLDNLGLLFKKLLDTVY